MASTTTVLLSVVVLFVQAGSTVGRCEDAETSMLSLSHSSSGCKRKRAEGGGGAGGGSSGNHPDGLGSAEVSMNERFVNSTSSWEGSTSTFGNKVSQRGAEGCACPHCLFTPQL